MKRLAAVAATAIAIAAAGLLPGRATLAATDTGTVTVTATVADACLIGSPTLAFGAYDPLVANVATPLDATTSLTISCTGGTPWSVGLGNGANASGLVRRMLSGAADYLTYELYLDAGRTQRWGDAVVAERASGTLATTGSQTLTIYGRIPAAQLPPRGAYADVVTATIYF